MLARTTDNSSSTRFPCFVYFFKRSAPTKKHHLVPACFRRHSLHIAVHIHQGSLYAFRRGTFGHRRGMAVILLARNNEFPRYRQTDVGIMKQQLSLRPGSLHLLFDKMKCLQFLPCTRKTFPLAQRLQIPHETLLGDGIIHIWLNVIHKNCFPQFVIDCVVFLLQR